MVVVVETRCCIYTSLQYILATHLLLVDQQMRPTYGHVHAYIHTITLMVAIVDNQVLHLYKPP